MLIDDLIHLSKIFKDGYTVELKNNKLNQYSNTNKPFIVSYLTVIEIKNNKILYVNVPYIPITCIIGGWFSSKENTFYIELNEAFKTKKEALIFAKKYSQKAIYNLNTMEAIDC